ncbi:MAG TPA: glycoside hydrolase family 15 protein, partial [Candidatus Competibacteraceae bacterium]|nr:glycoside hydrolase family 15 protein [Candidatus Competibacteraceae bacterium]
MDKNSFSCAPGGPGLLLPWTSSAKSGIGTALSDKSLVWFTLSHGILNEIYYPDPDRPRTRDLGLIVTAGEDFFSEEKVATEQQVAYLEEGVPGYHLVNTCKAGRYRLEKVIITDPKRSVLLQQTRLTALTGQLEDYRLYALLTPHADSQQAETARIINYRGAPALLAEQDDYVLALVCSTPWRNSTAGFVGVADGWHDLQSHKRLTRHYSRAENGHVTLLGEIDLPACQGAFVLALGFAHSPGEAIAVALSSLKEGFPTVQSRYVNGWRQWQQTLTDLSASKSQEPDLYRLSAAVMRSHESKNIPGGIVASLSIPWGSTRTDKGGYHLVWPRDLVEVTGGLLAIGNHEDAKRILRYLKTTQHSDGHWSQNMWLDGTPRWQGIQLDETALPVLLIDLAYHEGALNDDELAGLWPMMRRAVSYLVHTGPVTPQDRWERNKGYTPFTLAVMIAALLVAAESADREGETEVAVYLRETADFWNASLEDWLYVSATDLAYQVGVEGYYVRLAPPDEDGLPAFNSNVWVANRPTSDSVQIAAQHISVDALALVRFGLREASDPRILNTVRVIDALLKVETPNGLAWRRYNGDGYGEHDDGSPYDGTGVGRAWPVLTGERGHYELAAGNRTTAEKLLSTMARFAGNGGLIPEQIWDRADIPERGLYCGQPSGSAMPLLWAHAEYIKLRRSLREGRLFDLPP